MLKVTCPKNSKHDRFETTAHVTQDWIVDNTGEFVRVSRACVQTDHGPMKGNIFTCCQCGWEAIVEET
jgi:hypothetical protein